MSAILQIGLHFQCEYLRLLGYEDESIDNMPVSFIEFQNEEWTEYFGIDMNAEYIAFHKNNTLYNADRRVHFIEALLHKNDGTIHKHTGFQVLHGVYPDDIENYKYEATAISLNTLLSEIGADIKLLAIDVEGVELDILQGFDFQHRPRYTIVEIHNQDNIEKLKNFMNAKDYRLVEFTRKGPKPLTDNSLIQTQMGFMDKAFLPKFSFYLP